MKKTELLLAKPSLIESLVNEIYKRKEAGHQAQGGGLEQQASVFGEMIAQWEALTTMRIEGDTAIIPMRGMVTPDEPFAAFYGETNLVSVMKNFDSAMANPKVKRIVANIYSPGGYVYGVEAASNRVFAARGKGKSLIAYTDSLAASAAYWFASAFDKVVVGSETAEVGSIGVYCAHFDYSEMLAKEGIKVTEITSGEFKGIGSPYEAMTPKEKEVLQQDSNFVYTRFVNTVARNRGIAVSEVLKSANGLTFYGSEAVKLGLADSINTFQEVLEMTTGSQPNAGEQTAEQKAAATAAAKAELAAEARAKAAEDKLAAFEAAAAKAANETAAKECQDCIKATFGRDASATEVASFQGMSVEARATYKATLSESKANHDKLVAKAGLTTEQVLGGKEVNEGENNLVLAAAERLGFTNKQ